MRTWLWVGDDEEPNSALIMLLVEDEEGPVGLTYGGFFASGERVSSIMACLLIGGVLAGGWELVSE